MSTPAADLIGAREACQVAGIKRSTLTYWLATGRLAPAMKLPGRTGSLLFSRGDVEAAKAKAAS